MWVVLRVPIESVSMKLFTGLESFEIMAIPFFILAGNFLSHGGVARRMINFAVSLIGHWGGTGACRNRCLRDVRPGLRIEHRDRCGNRRDRAARDGSPWLSDALWCRHHHDRRLARHIDAALDSEDRLRGIDQHVDRRLVRGGTAAGHAAYSHAVHGHVVSRQTPELPESESVRINIKVLYCFHQNNDDF